MKSTRFVGSTGPPDTPSVGYRRPLGASVKPLRYLTASARTDSRSADGKSHCFQFRPAALRGAPLSVHCQGIPRMVLDLVLNGHCHRALFETLLDVVNLLRKQFRHVHDSEYAT
jgi:hypothetical protein